MQSINTMPLLLFSWSVMVLKIKARMQQGKLWLPSVILDEPTASGGTEMTKADIKMMREAFVNGIFRAKKSGFDGIQLHVAHGYLLSSFLTPYYNQRTDEYGGNTTNRARVVIEICEDIRKAICPNYPILAKINCSDFMDGSLTFHECKQIFKMLEGVGLSAAKIAELLNIPVICVGGHRDINKLEKIINET